MKIICFYGEVSDQINGMYYGYGYINWGNKKIREFAPVGNLKDAQKEAIKKAISFKRKDIFILVKKVEIIIISKKNNTLELGISFS